MHYSSILVTLAAASLTRAEYTLEDFPNCAAAPLQSGISKTLCTLTDTSCICASAGFLGPSDAAVKEACSSSDEATAIKVIKGLCAQAGNPLSIPASLDAVPVSTVAPLSIASPVSPTASSATFMLPLGEFLISAAPKKDTTLSLAPGNVVIPSSFPPKKKQKTTLSLPMMGAVVPPVVPSPSLSSTETSSSSSAGASSVIPSTILLPSNSSSRSTMTLTATVTSTYTSTISLLTASQTSVSTATIVSAFPFLNDLADSYPESQMLSVALYPTGNGSAMANSTNATALQFTGIATSQKSMGAATATIIGAMMVGMYFF